MIILKSAREIVQMRAAGKIVAACHQEIAEMIRPGITTWAIDQHVENYIRKHGATPAQIGYRGYRYATCASVNDEICHGFPRHEPLREGDIVCIDFVVNLDGWLADSAWSYSVGQTSSEAEQLMAVTLASLQKGIEQAQPRNRIGDIGHAIQSYVEGQGFSVVRDFTGHGIGQVIHEDLWVPHFGAPGKGTRLHEGMVFTIEPMVNVGTWRCTMDDNGWTARTADGSLSAQFEHTIAITSHGPEILTSL